MIMTQFAQLKPHIIVAFQEVGTTHITVQHLRCSHEEADIKLILHAPNATLRV